MEIRRWHIQLRDNVWCLVELNKKKRATNYHLNKIVFRARTKEEIIEFAKKHKLDLEETIEI